MKYVILHVDGITDQPRTELGGKTPLQAASISHLDDIAQRGEFGVLTIPPENGRYGSGLAGTCILGYEPRKFYQGPGPLEAASLGVTVGEHDVVYRCTMVALKAELQPGVKGGAAEIKKLGHHVIMEDATAGLITGEEARELIDAANEQLGSEIIQFYPGSGHRHLMVWVNGKSRALGTDPQSLVGKPIGDALPAGDGADMLRKIMDASLTILQDHPVNDERREAGLAPANCLWLWGEGRAVAWPSLTERFRVSGAVVSSSDVHRGVGLLAGLEAVDPERLAGSDLATRASVALEELKKKDFVYVHVELPDTIVYGTDVKAKVTGIEDIDRELVRPLLQGMAQLGPYRLMVLCDSGGVQQGRPAEGQWVYSYCDSSMQQAANPTRRFTEIEAQASTLAPRDATKFVIRLFAKPS